MKEKNKLICDIKTGVCGVSEENEEMELINFNQPKKTVDLYYVTDPICSHCWAFEPVLRRFSVQYGHYFHFHTVMGGLLEKWHDGPIDPANGIFKPADVAGHWREVGKHLRMPIDGSLMIDNPVQSSFPPSRVFKIIQKHHNDDRAREFLRRARESLFVFNKNISDQAILIEIVNQMGLNGGTIINETDRQTGRQLLNEDFALAGRLGVRGFPTVIMINKKNKCVKIVGGRPLDQYVTGLKQVLNKEKLEPKKPPSLSELLAQEKLLFSKEIEVMYDIDKTDVKSFIKKELPAGQYEMKEFLGELYIIGT